MFRGRKQSAAPIALAAGAVLGTAALSLGIVSLVRRRGRKRVASELDRLEEAAVDALLRDTETGGSAIEVAVLAPGIVELTGVVPTQDVGQRAARLLHALPGVRTVVNRLDTGSIEDRLALNRARRARGEPVFQERQWYGVRVGTGRRRQSIETEPPRPDDTVPRRMRELEVSGTDADDAPPADLSNQGQGS